MFINTRIPNQTFFKLIKSLDVKSIINVEMGEERGKFLFKKILCSLIESTEF